ncbi:IS66 family insertion sequence element accessory protein TnpA [Desulfobacula toluolica]|uniref:Conserved uncharacterized protein n=1 Tax=Desulfobacula toluolica (strain DSM 7467 / Tol2) TaxID=651182 RepID=K0NNB2_DESTT|nr:hypothetical protein [Desulfobacula toluolica]CCK80227.1 conserved uncharacterized protein [Desulfobacula toluolica Tol2]
MSDRSKEANRKRTQFWKHHIEEWSKSELSQNAYCRENGLKPNQLTYWKNKFKRQNLPAEFAQVSPVQIAELLNSRRERLLLNIDSGYQIEIPDGFSHTTLAQVLQVLRGE